MRSETMTDREIVEAVATRVMGWTFLNNDEVSARDAGVVRPIYQSWLRPDKTMITLDDWSPLTDHNHAMQVAEKMRERGETDPVFINFVRGLPSEDCVDLMFRLSPRLICLAALAAVKGEGK